VAGAGRGPGTAAAEERGSGRWQDTATTPPGRAVQACDRRRMPMGRPRERRENGPGEREKGTSLVNSALFDLIKIFN
jgi:hypothetical protein